MSQRYLEVSYRKGKPLAAYLYLARKSGDVSARTDRPEPGFVVDRAGDGRAIGVEITSPAKVTLAALNRVLAAINEAPATPDELAPLLTSQTRASQA